MRSIIAATDARVASGSWFGTAEYTGDFGSLVNTATAENPGLTWNSMLGHSMGGGIVFAYGVDHPDDYDLMVLSGPRGCRADRGQSDQDSAGQSRGVAAANLPIEDLDDTAVTRDPEMLAAYRNDPLVHHGKIPAGIGKALLLVGDTMPQRARALTAAARRPRCRRPLGPRLGQRAAGRMAPARQTSI